MSGDISRQSLQQNPVETHTHRVHTSICTNIGCTCTHTVYTHARTQDTHHTHVHVHTQSVHVHIHIHRGHTHTERDKTPGEQVPYFLSALCLRLPPWMLAHARCHARSTGKRYTQTAGELRKRLRDTVHRQF